MLTNTPTLNGNSRQMPLVRHTQIVIHGVKSKIEECECLSFPHTGSPMASEQTVKLCELGSLLFTPRDNDASVLSVSSSFLPFHSLYMHPVPLSSHPSLALPLLQDDHLQPLHHAAGGRTRLVDHDVWSVREEPALWTIHEGAVISDGAGLQEPVSVGASIRPSTYQVEQNA